MGLYLDCRDQIGFDVSEGNDDDWLRADVDPEGVSFDRGGLCKLGRRECEQLADWLLRASRQIVETPPPAAKVKKQGRGRPPGARVGPPAVKRAEKRLVGA